MKLLRELQQVGLGPYVVKYIATVSAYVETKLLAKVLELPKRYGTTCTQLWSCTAQPSVHVRRPSILSKPWCSSWEFAARPRGKS